MARLGESADRGGGTHRGDGGRRRTSAGNRGTTVIVAVAVALVVGLGVWWQASSPGVELVRSSEGAAEPEDPDGVDVGDGETTEAESEADTATAGDAAAEAAPATTKVHVDGAVLAPGVYELLGEDPRVADAVAAAGGLVDGADTYAVNLAARLADGDKVHIPAMEEAAAPVPGVGEIPEGSSTTAPATASPDSSGSSVPSSTPVNINTASAEELTVLPGIGEKTAEKIVADREAQGPFASPEDLMRVSGIGEKKFAQVRDLICV